MSLPPRGAWIEIDITPQFVYHDFKSLPPRGAWIEIKVVRMIMAAFKSLPPRGAWIEIIRHDYRGPDGVGRSPRGERGLKSFLSLSSLRFSISRSLPPRGAWIEIILPLSLSLEC